MKKNLCLAALLSSLCFGQSALASTVGVWNETLDAGDTPGTAQDLTGTGVLNTINGSITAPGTDTDVFRIYVSDPASFSITMTGTLLSEDNDTTLYVLDDSANLVFADGDGGVGWLSQLNVGQFASHSAGFYLVAYNIFESFVLDDSSTEFGINALPALPFHVTGWHVTEDYLQFGTVQLNFTGARFDAPPLPSSVPAPVSLTLTLLGLAGFAFSKRYSNSGQRKIMYSHG